MCGHTVVSLLVLHARCLSFFVLPPAMMRAVSRSLAAFLRGRGIRLSFKFQIMSRGA